jgi:hypothetical protein
MKKMIFSFIAVSAMAIALLSWKHVKSANDGAIVINDFGCGLIDGDGNFAFTDISHAVVTPSGNGGLTCRAQVPNSTGKAVIYNNIPCGTPAGFTTNGRETVSASGQATLTCNVH